MITRDEWFRALGDAAQPADDDALTIKELAQQFRIHPMTLYRRLGQMIADGRVVRAVKIVTVSGGYRRRLPAYKLVAAKPEPKKKSRRRG